MKIKITLLLIVSHFLTFSQISFQDRTTLIDDIHNPSDINSIAIADLDNDNWKDLIITTYDDKIMWYKNVNGDFRHFQSNFISLNQIDIPKYITTADLNNDGLLDLIVINDSVEDKIFWFENLGSGNFSTEILIANSINGASSIETIDIDNDGDIDLLTGGQTDTVILLENNNDGTFQNPLTIYDGNYYTRQVKSVDLDNDGLSDIISSHSDGSIYWAKNLGNNTFGNREYITGSSDSGSALDFIDANEDGYLDIVTANNYSADNVRYILNQNGNSFDNDNPIIIDNSIQDPYQVDVKDIDNDGKDDIIVSFWTNDNLSWYRNLGNGNFSSSNLISNTLYNSKSFSIEDIDNDGLKDIISSSNPSSIERKLSLFKNEGNGTVFQEIIINHYYGNPNKIKIADLNNDNKNDIIVACNDIIWFENYGTEFSSYKIISSNNNTTYQNFIDIIIEDINDDGHKDILGFNLNYISILTNNNDETFTDQIFQYAPTTSFRNPIYADFDGDNLKDLLVSIPTSGSEHHIGFIKRLDNNTFGTLQIIDIPLHNGTSRYRIFDMDQNDVDNDGDIDIILSSSSVSTIKIMRNDGSANFTFEDATNNGNTVPYRDKKIHVEDIDNDNFGDIILYNDRYDNQASYFVTILIKNNQGSLIGNNSYIDDSGTTVSAVTFTDIDNNGYKDLICASSSHPGQNLEDTIFYYLNDGSSFQSKVYVDNRGYYSLDRDIILEDLNNDNKPDIVTSYFDKRGIDYFLNSSTLSIVEQETNTDGFTFYPVPFSNTLNWSNTTEQNSLSFEIYTIDGKKIFSKSDYQENNINLEFLAPGIYLIKMNYPNNVQVTRKIIKK